MGHSLHLRRDSPELVAEAFRFGVQFADGRKATNLAAPWPTGPDETPEGPILVLHSGGGGGKSWTQNLWVWPLPPAGPLAFVCEWPAEGIELTRVAIDAGLILDAAERAETLWDNGGPQEGGGSVVQLIG